MPKTKHKIKSRPKETSLQERLFPLMFVAIVILSFMVGSLWQKVASLGAATAIVASNTNNASNSVAAVAAAGIPLPATVSTTVTGATAPTSAPAAAVAATVSTDTIKSVFAKQAIKFGDSNGKLTFVEIADPSCPYCHAAAGHNPELSKQMGAQFILASDGGSYVAPVDEIKKLVDAGKAAFAYIYFPGHGNGEMGMKALYCAQEKGKFWEAHELLMNNAGYNLMNTDIKNDKAQSGKLAEFLKSAVDPTFLKSCLDSGKYDKTLTEDSSLATSLSITGTPSFFINTKNFAGAYNWTDMKATADAALQ